MNDCCRSFDFEETPEVEHLTIKKHIGWSEDKKHYSLEVEPLKPNTTYGLIISNFTETQQQSMFIAWFFIVIFILMSGLFTPIESMPKWAQNVTLFNPIRYFVEFIRMVLLKGAGLQEVLPNLGIITLFAIVVNGLAVWSYKKTN